MIYLGGAPLSWARKPRERRGYPEFDVLADRRRAKAGRHTVGGPEDVVMSNDVRRVLVIEDDRVLQSLLAELLVSEGYVLLQSGNGTDGLRLAREHRPDAILLDLVVPGTSGLEVLETLKADAETRDIPVIVISASARLMLAEEVRRADSVLQKPFDVDDLLDRLETALARPPSRFAYARVS